MGDFFLLYFFFSSSFGFFLPSLFSPLLLFLPFPSSHLRRNAYARGFKGAGRNFVSDDTQTFERQRGKEAEKFVENKKRGRFWRHEEREREREILKEVVREREREGEYFEEIRRGRQEWREDEKGDTKKNEMKIVAEWHIIWGRMNSKYNINVIR